LADLKKKVGNSLSAEEWADIENNAKKAFNVTEKQRVQKRYEDNKKNIEASNELLE
jgi:hypothetical protein